MARKAAVSSIEPQRSAGRLTCRCASLRCNCMRAMFRSARACRLRCSMSGKSRGASGKAGRASGSAKLASGPHKPISTMSFSRAAKALSCARARSAAASASKTCWRACCRRLQLPTLASRRANSPLFSAARRAACSAFTDSTAATALIQALCVFADSCVISLRALSLAGASAPN